MSDSYSCEKCGSEYHFCNAYDSYEDTLGEIVYIIYGWYGCHDNWNICNSCWEDS